MRQVIARIDDELHARLKAKAAADGRSLNDILTEALTAAIDGENERAKVWARLAARGARVVPPKPSRVPTPAVLERITRGAGNAASTALADERSAR
ncbi:MAG: toxin-antitoxin system HicB family antitoxin [Actinomycetota bacterium]|nr:toxin-antitoxin system HicB family antitoxin [Actinomycetota bacterium]